MEILKSREFWNTTIDEKFCDERDTYSNFHSETNEGIQRIPLILPC